MPGPPRQRFEAGDPFGLRDDARRLVLDDRAAGDLNLILAELRRLGRASVAPPLEYGSGPSGRHWGISRAEPVYVLLSASSSPYSWSEAERTASGGSALLAGGRTGTAYEANGVAGLGGLYTTIDWMPESADWRFQAIRQSSSSPGCSAYVAIYPGGPCDISYPGGPPNSGDFGGGWGYYGANRAAYTSLTAVLTNSSGTTIGTLPTVGGGYVLALSPAVAGDYHLAIAQAPSISVTFTVCNDSVGPFGQCSGGPGSRTNVHPTIYFDPDAVGYDFTIACPGSSNFSFSGPAMTSYSMLVEFQFPYFLVPASAFPDGCGYGIPCCRPPGGWTAQVTMSSGDVFDFALDGTTGLYSGCYLASNSGTLSPVLLLPSDGADPTLSGTIVYSKTVNGTVFTVTRDFALPFCSGPYQIISTPAGPCS